MIWVRKGLVHLFGLILLVSLLGTALSTSANLAFAHPSKVESWLNQSNLYGHFVSDTIDQAKKAAGSTENQGSVTLSDTAVQQAANSTFTTSLFQNSVSTFLNSNYAWLEGKTAQPSFTIDLTQAKQNFAKQVGQYVQDHIASLPVCTAQQLAEIGNVENVDPLNITCQPPGLSAPAEATLVTQKIQSSSQFLSNPVITANNINPNGGSSSQPYYQKFSKAPKLYSAAVKLPWIYAVVAALSALGVIFVAQRKRLGLRRVSIALILAGAILIAIKFLANTALSQLEKHIFNSSTNGQLQQALTSFLSRAEHQLTRVDLWFSISYLLLAVIILIVLRFGRRRSPASTKPIPPGESGSIADRLRDDSQNSAPPAQPEQPPPKRRRLIQ